MIDTALLRKNFQAISAKESVRSMNTLASEGVVRLRGLLLSVTRSLSHFRSWAAKARSGIVVAATAVLPQLAMLWRPTLGAYAVSIALFTLLLLALTDSRARKLAISAAILPLAGMVGVIMPVTQDVLLRVGIQYGVILALSLVYRYMFKLHKPLKRQRVGLKSYPYVLPIMIIIGELLGVAGYGMLRHQYAFKGMSQPLVAVVAVMFAVTEELFFRGLIQHHAAKLMHPAYASVLGAIVYAGAAIGMGSMLPVGFALLAATVMSVIYIYKQNLILTTTANVAMKLTYIGLIATFILRP